MVKVIDSTNLGYLLGKIKAAFWRKSEITELPIDTTPTASSSNLVTSGGVKAYVDQHSSGGGTWGSITGTLADQTDLASALGAKYEKPSGGIPATDLASGVIPTVPTISTNITTDATSDTKTASPKAVKDYVDGAVEANPTVPSGTTPTALSNLKVGNGYYSVPESGTSDVSVGATKDNDADFEISDDSDNVLARFKDGHIKTKEFDSSNTPQEGEPIDNDADFEISDDSDNVLARFKDGHIKTKEFDSSNIKDVIWRTYLDTRAKCLLLTYDFSTSISQDFAANANWSVVAGRLVSSAPGVTNRLANSLPVTVSQKRTYCRFTAASNSYFGVGWLSSAYSYDGSLFSVDVATGQFSIHDSWTSASVIPSVMRSKSLAFIVGRDYEMVIEKDGHTNRMWIVDCLTGEESEVIEANQSATSGAGEFAGGRQMDKLNIVHISGTSPAISYVRSVSKYAEPLVIVYGDSITEGDRVFNGQTYVDLLKDYFGDDRVMCSALSGSVVSSVIDRMDVELPLLKPQFVIVTIGSNGGNSQELFNSAKQKILDNGAIPIFCVPPMGANDLATLRGYILNLGVTTARLDIATAVNYDISQGQNSALFADSLHPNALGHQAIAKKILSDCQILKCY